jgi:type I restriction enzyme S subunit
MNAPVIFEQARKRVSGSGVPDLHLIEIRDFKIPIPHIDEQTEIVRLVEQHFALADTLEKNLKNAKQKVDNLTQSILAKAFRGELVPQDPNDEPAEQLLARIKAARAEAELLEKAAKKVTSKTKRQKGVVS